MLFACCRSDQYVEVNATGGKGAQGTVPHMEQDDAGEGNDGNRMKKIIDGNEEAEEKQIVSSSGAEQEVLPRHEQTVAQVPPELAPGNESESPARLVEQEGAERSNHQTGDLSATSKEKYQTAVNLLHKRIIQKESRLTITERSFLHRLLEDTEDEESALSDRLSAIESSIFTLDHDPLFTKEDSPPRGGTVRGIDRDRDRSRECEKSQTSTIEVLSTGSSQFDVQRALNRVQVQGKRYYENIEEDIIPMVPNMIQRENPSSSRQYQRYHSSQSHHHQVEEPSVRYGQMLPLQMQIDEQNSNDHQFKILGDLPTYPMLSISLMNVLRQYLPDTCSKMNFWLKFVAERDGATIRELLQQIRASYQTIICIHAADDSIFGAMTSSPWRQHESWFGTSDAFLFRLVEGQIEVYPCTGHDERIQYCTSQIMAIGGGVREISSGPSAHEPQGIGLSIDGDLKGGETNSCATFANAKLCASATDPEFRIERLEVWTFTPCPSVEEAEKLELQKLFVESVVVSP